MSYKEIFPLAGLDFGVACHSIAISQDNRKILLAGVYKPTVKLFDLKSGIMKFERHLNSDPIKILCLEEDGEKFAVLKNDKSVEFHIKGGFHEKIRTPTQPKDILLNGVTAEVYLGSTEIYRFNLEQGRFLKSVNTGAFRMSLSSSHGLLGVAQKNSVVFVDTRTKENILVRHTEHEAIAIAQDNTGLRYSIGTEDDKVIEYDLRSNNPLRIIESERIKKVEYNGKEIVVGGTKSITLIEGDGKEDRIDVGFEVSDFGILGESIFVGGESPTVKVYSQQE